VEFRLTEGRNRQIRRMAEAVGLEVLNIHRVAFAGITIRGLAEGQSLPLDAKEMKLIAEAIQSYDQQNGRTFVLPEDIEDDEV
jgi:23S rRNA pseudouridine2605 synthase